MMNLNRLFTDTLTYWAPSTTRSAMGGETIVAAPITVTGKFFDKQKTLMDEKSQVFVSSGYFFTTTPITKQGYIYNGTSTETNPEGNLKNQAFQIIKTEHIVNKSTGTEFYKGYIL